jgi:arginine decarboxylase
MSRKPVGPPEERPSPLAFVPSRVFFTSGKGVHEHERVAVQHALREAGVADCNLVKVSSVIPPGCRHVSREEGTRLLRPGNMVFAVIAQAVTTEPHQRLTVGVGWALPDLTDCPGYASEIEEEQAKGLSPAAAAAELGPTAIRLVAEKLRVPADAETLWGKRRGGFELGRATVKAGCLTETVVGDERGRSTAAVALAVYV